MCPASSVGEVGARMGDRDVGAGGTAAVSLPHELVKTGRM